jgi:hypothetical protein
VEWSVDIGGSDGHVSLGFPSRDPDVGDWGPYHLEVVVAVEIQGSLDRGEFRATVYGGFLFPPVLRQLASDMATVVDRLDGSASFGSDPDGLDCQIELEAGKGTVSGRVSSRLDKNELRFSFSTDQSYLQATARQLDALVATFPER